MNTPTRNEKPRSLPGFLFRTFAGMKADQGIILLHKLGELLRLYFAKPEQHSAHPFLSKLHKTIHEQHRHNAWFTPENVLDALSAIAQWLYQDKLSQWISPYPLPGKGKDQRTIGIVMAGNLPLVGFHDFLAGFLSGHRMQIRLSSKDPDLLPLLCNYLFEQEISLKKQIRFTKERFTNIDAAIATGSSNTARYFEYAFASRPHIIRHHRNSIAILDGNETEKQLKILARDVFMYYGLGCRNVTKIYLPDESLLPQVIACWQTKKKMANNPKYAGNYRYQKAIHQTLGETILDGNFFLIKENSAFNTPVAVVHYEIYTEPFQIRKQINRYKDQIQCIIGNGYQSFGSSQNPELTDYADHIDSLKFLSEL